MDDESAGAEIVDDGYGLGWGTDETTGAGGVDFGGIFSNVGGFLGDLGNAAVTFANARTNAERTRLQSDLTRASLQGQVDLTRARTAAEVRRLTTPQSIFSGLLPSSASGGIVFSPMLLLLLGVGAYVVMNKK